jgi:putative restriction endonuclease
VHRHQKYNLLEKIVNSVNEDGWNIFYLSDPKYHPFRLKIYNDKESYNIRIYIWNLTHGGGAARPADEYRIQITGVDRFEAEVGGKTIILGWWEEGNVFAGFDFNKHTSNLGFSPSIQIREAALRKAYINGFSPWTKENQETAIAFRPDFFVEYVRNLESLHSFGESKNDFEALENIAEKPNEINDTILNSISTPRRLTVANVTKKVRDNGFKARVLTAYSQKCAFCGLQLKLVDAAHILPVSYSGSTDETCNGISMCALHHRAFDRSLVTINEEYQIIHNDRKLEKLVAIKLNGGAEDFVKYLRPFIILPPALNDRPHIDYIKKANEIRGWELNF